MKEELLKVLIVDDDQEDIELTMEVLEMTKILLNVETANDGQEAMDMLNERADKAPKELPDLILLDLNMPRKNGLETLAEIKKHETLMRIPVVVLTTSKSEEDIIGSYSKGVSCYITKPVGLSEFQTVVEAINNFWFTVVKYPGK